MPKSKGATAIHATVIGINREDIANNVISVWKQDVDIKQTVAHAPALQHCDPHMISGDMLELDRVTIVKRALQDVAW